MEIEMTKMQLIEKFLIEMNIHPSRHASVTKSLMKRKKSFLNRYVAAQIASLNGPTQINIQGSNYGTINM